MQAEEIKTTTTPENYVLVGEDPETKEEEITRVATTVIASAEQETDPNSLQERASHIGSHTEPYPLDDEFDAVDRFIISACDAALASINYLGKLLTDDPEENP